MAVDGVYNVTMKTPLGEQQAKWTLKVDGESLSGIAESPAAGRVEFSGGSVDGDDFTFSLTMQNPMMGQVRVDILGTVQGDKISGVATTPLGQAPFSGSRA